MCLNILREDWKPVLSINSVIYGLQFLFLVRSLDVGVQGLSGPTAENLSAINKPSLSVNMS